MDNEQEPTDTLVLIIKPLLFLFAKNQIHVTGPLCIHSVQNKRNIFFRDHTTSKLFFLKKRAVTACLINFQANRQLTEHNARLELRSDAGEKISCEGRAWTKVKLGDHLSF